jgi:truncated hemoglobin YjbI
MNADARPTSYDLLDQWMACMTRAMTEIGIDASVRQVLANAFPHNCGLDA